MTWKRIVATIAGTPLVLVGISLTPIGASAIDPCEITVTRGGVAVSTSDVERSSYSIYCVAKFKTVANNYSFTVPAGITKLDYLVVGGGGGGASGGGGAGGVLMANDYAVTPGAAITIAVGAGGVGGAGNSSPPAGKGSNSSFGSIIALGGGRGGAGGASGTEVNGASGGGSRYDCTNPSCGAGIAGTGTSGQGSSGGYSTYGSYGAGGGGGGAGGAGFNTTQLHQGARGGIGVTSSITGTSLYYGGGGGGGINNNNNQRTDAHGGPGGLGGGGTGSAYGYAGGTPGANATATAGAANTGGGGGGTDPEDINAGAGGSGVVILRWVSNANLKTITFNSNTATPTTTTQRVGADVSTPLTANPFSRTGFVFMGWTAAADGSGTVYSDGQSFSTSSDVTLYAKWEAGVTHTIVFDANGGTGTMASQTAGASVAINPNQFTRTNFTFNGWNTSADGSGFSYPAGAIYAFQSSTTLYAQWRAVVATYTVSFFGNGAEGGTTASQSASATTSLNLNGFTRTGYSFLGWHTNNGSSSAQYLDGQSYAFTSDLALYAIWAIQADRTLSFNGNNSTSGSTSSQVARSGTVLNTNGFARSGHTFRNWNTAADGSGVTYQPNYVYSFAAALTLYAQWGANYTITYNSNSADSGSVPGSQSSYVGSPGLNLGLNAGNLKRAGYRLAGWNTNSSATGTPYALGASSVTFTESKTLYAQWAPAVYSVIYSPNGALAGVEPPAVTFTVGRTVTVARNDGQLEKPGFTFGGWSTTPNGTGTLYEPATANVSLSEDTTLYAVWISPSGSSSGGGSSFNSLPTTSPTPTVTSKPTVNPKPRPTPTPNATPTARPQVPSVSPEAPNGDQILAQGGLKPGTVEKSEPLVKRLIEELAAILKPIAIDIANKPAPAPNETLDSETALQAAGAGADKRVLDLPSLVQVGNELQPSRIVLIKNTKLQLVTANGGVLNVQAKDGETPIPVDSTGRVQMVRSNTVETGGAGLRPNSEFAVYLFSEPILLGVGKTDSLGNFYASFPVDEKLPLGEHTLQVNGITAAGDSSSISLPVVVVESQAVASKNAMVSTDGPGTGAWTISNYICWLLILLLLLIIAFIVRRIYLASRKKIKHK